MTDVANSFTLTTPKSSPIQLPRGAGRGFIERVVSNPVLVDPHRVAEFEGCLASLVGHERFEMFMDRMAADDGYWPRTDSWENDYKPYNVKDGVLQIPVFGALINRMGYQMGRYATGYTYIERAFERGMEDGNVKGIAFLIDSPGGEAAGNFELVDKLVEGRGKKAMRSFVADAAYSGGYSIATAAKEIVVTRSGGTGSVGVVTMHVDMSGYLTQMGMKVTFIKAGKHKVDGNRFEPLSEDAQKRIQARIDKIYGVFVSTVAKNRAMSEDDVRATEALTYDADESVEIGFADRIGAFDEELATFANEAADETGEDNMTDKTQTPATITQEALDAAVTAARAEGEVAGAKTGATNERARFGAVMSAPEYTGREALATKMLTTTDLSADAIKGLLSDAPKVEAEKPKAKTEGERNHFKERMDAEGGAGVEAEGDDDDPSVSTPEKDTNSILASFKAAGGATVKKTK